MSDILRQLPGDRADVRSQGDGPAHHPADGNQAPAVGAGQVSGRQATDAELRTIATLSRAQSDYVAGHFSAHQYLLLVAVIVRRHFAAQEAVSHATPA